MKTKKFKLLTSLSCLGVLCTTAPVAITACSNNKDDEDPQPKTLTDVTYMGAEMPANLGNYNVNDDSLTFDLNDFKAKRSDGTDANLVKLEVSANPVENVKIESTSQVEGMSYKLTVLKSSSTTINFGVYDGDGYYGTTKTTIQGFDTFEYGSPTCVSGE